MARKQTTSIESRTDEHGRKYVELWAVYRIISNDRAEIAEKPDGACLIYPTKAQAKRAADKLPDQWLVDTIWVTHKGYVL